MGRTVVSAKLGRPPPPGGGGGGGAIHTAQPSRHTKTSTPRCTRARITHTLCACSRMHACTHGSRTLAARSHGSLNQHTLCPLRTHARSHGSFNSVTCEQAVRTHVCTQLTQTRIDQRRLQPLSHSLRTQPHMQRNPVTHTLSHTRDATTWRLILSVTRTRTQPVSDS